MRTLLLLPLFFSSFCLAEVEYYKWIDEQGHIHYGENKPSSGNSTNIILKNSANIENKRVRSLKKQNEDREKTTNKLIQYTSTNQARRKKIKAQKRRCRNAKESMKKLKYSFKNRVKDPKTGGYIYPTSRVQDSMIAYQQRSIAIKQSKIDAACKKRRIK